MEFLAHNVERLRKAVVEVEDRRQIIAMHDLGRGDLPLLFDLDEFRLGVLAQLRLEHDFLDLLLAGMDNWFLPSQVSQLKLRSLIAIAAILVDIIKTDIALLEAGLCGLLDAVRRQGGWDLVSG